MNAKYLLGRLLWLVGSVLLVVIAALPFDRFDPARRLVDVGQMRKKKRAKTAERTENVETEPIVSPIQAITLTPLDKSCPGGGWLTVVAAELRLLLAGKSWWWYTGALGLMIACLAVSHEPLRIVLLTIAWVWPTMVWSQLGNREHQYHTAPLLFSSARVVYRQLPAAWVAGTLVALILGSGYALRLMIAGDVIRVLALIAGAVFVSSLALVLGVWSGSGRWFQVLYPLLCYLGLSGKLVWFDFKGVNPEAVVTGIPFLYLALTTGFIVLAVAGRRYQMVRS
jgi:hypothetical protein